MSRPGHSRPRSAAGREGTRRKARAHMRQGQRGGHWEGLVVDLQWIPSGSASPRCREQHPSLQVDAVAPSPGLDWVHILWPHLHSPRVSYSLLARQPGSGMQRSHGHSCHGLMSPRDQVCCAPSVSFRLALKWGWGAAYGRDPQDLTWGPQGRKADGTRQDSPRLHPLNL